MPADAQTRELSGFGTPFAKSDLPFGFPAILTGDTDGRQKARRRTRRGRDGLEDFDKLAPLLARLHDVGCERDKAGNRTLHFDQ